MITNALWFILFLSLSAALSLMLYIYKNYTDEQSDKFLSLIDQAYMMMTISITVVGGICISMLF